MISDQETLGLCAAFQEQAELSFHVSISNATPILPDQCHSHRQSGISITPSDGITVGPTHQEVM